MDALRQGLNSLADYPRWLVVACGAVVGALAIYLLAKLLKFGLHLVAAVVLIGGLGLAVWLLLK